MTERAALAVLTARAIRPGYRSGRTFRHIVIAGGKVSALADTAAEAARAAGPSASWVDLGSACVGPGFIDTHIHAVQAAADVRLVSLREAASLADLLAAVGERARRRWSPPRTSAGSTWPPCNASSAPATTREPAGWSRMRSSTDLPSPGRPARSPPR